MRFRRCKPFTAKNVTEVSYPPIAYQRNILENFSALSEAWRIGCASCRILGMLGSIGLYVTTNGTLWSDFDLVLSARASSLVTNEAFLIASCMHLFLYPLWMKWCSISFVRCWKRFSD